MRRVVVSRVVVSLGRRNLPSPGCSALTMRTVMLALLASLVASAEALSQTSWQRLSPATSPPARNYHALVYDQARARAVLFGGMNNAGKYLADTWEWVGATWLQRSPKASPPERGQHAMAYDAGRRRTVLFGGAVLQGRNVLALGDTWEWDGIQWIQRKPKTSPPARFNHAMAYDAARKRVVVFGGSGAPSDTWEWDGTNWLQRFPTNVPAGRAWHDMTYDTARKRVVLFGGSPARNDTWEWDGNNWMFQSSSTLPPARASHALAYDTARARVVLFGGNRNKNGGRQYLADTWEWDGKRWTRQLPITSPWPTEEHKMVYYAARGYVLLFGGREPKIGLRRMNTWAYSRTTPLVGSPSTISIATGGTHAFSLDARIPNANRLYWIFGSMTGTSPGVTVASAAGTVNIPLNPDLWTDFTIGFANSSILTKTRGTLNTTGQAAATFNVPKITNQSAIGVKFYHAYLVYDAKNNFYMTSNPVTLTLTK